MVDNKRFASFDLSQDHVLTVTVLQTSPTDTQWEETKQAMIDHYDCAEQKGYRFAIIFDLRLMGLLDMRFYQDWANLFVQQRERTAAHIECTSVVTSNPVIKAGMNLFFTHLYSSIRPLKFASDPVEGLAFIAEQRG
jgi:hypothetical protein